MKVMLVAVNAKYIHSNLAVYSLYSYAKGYQSDIVIGEYTINQRKDEILKAIYQEKPNVIGFSCYIWNISLILDIAIEIRKILPQTKIWLGGPEVSYDATKIMMEHDFIDGIMCGEGEQTFLELVAYYQEGKVSQAAIKGLVWRDSAGLIVTNEQRELMDLNDIPFVYEYFPTHRITYYESSRGCPFACSYCLSSVDKQLRFKDIAIVKKELQFFLDAQVPQVKFVDRTFNCKREHAMAIWLYLKEHDNGVTNFHFEISADLLSAEEILLLNSLRPGQIQLEIGVQSTNPQTITAINRTMDFAKLSKQVQAVAYGDNIHQHLDLIVGLPYEDYDSFKRSFDAVYALSPQQLQLGFLKVLKGSAMAMTAKEYDCQYQSKPPYEVLQTKWLSYDEIIRLKQIEEMVEIYYNSAQFEKTIKQVIRLFSSPFLFYQELGDFYERQGYTKVAHARGRRYDILLEFLSEREQLNLAYYQELMLFDLYAREKLKKRPAWAKEPVRYKDKKIHLEAFSYDLDSDKEMLLDKPVIILFDYEKRNMLTNNATIRMITEVID